MVRTCVYSVEENAALAENGKQKCMDNHDLGFLGPTNTNTSLVRNHNQCSTEHLSCCGGVHGKIERLKVARLDDVVVDDSPIQNSVAVHEQGRPSRL
jgi:hypothetical protein